MDFGKRILGKYGWKEGDGLGKNNTGIAVPLKASLKFDNAGLGVDRATEFNDHWWERCFNEAASNVTVEIEENGQVKTARKAGLEAVEISTKGYSARKLKKAKDQQKESDGSVVYENFLKSAMLTQDGGEVANEERIKAEDIAVAKINVLTDEQLFKACGGRTAHKGARHGLKLSGKLARLEQQEQEMLAKIREKSNPLKDPVVVEAEKPTKSKKKRKKDKCSEKQKPISENVNCETQIDMKPAKKPKFSEMEVVEVDPPIKTKKKKRKHNQEE